MQEEEKALWQAYTLNPCDKHKDNLFKQYQLLAIHIAKTRPLFPGSFLEREDLISIALLALNQAIERFNFLECHHFSSYLYIMVKRRIIDELRKFNKRSRVQIKRGAPGIAFVSLDIPVEGSVNWHEQIQDKQTVCPRWQAIMQEKKIILDAVIKNQRAQLQTVFDLYFIQGLSQPQIGKELNIGSSRVSQIKNEILQMLKPYLTSTSNFRKIAR